MMKKIWKKPSAQAPCDMVRFQCRTSCAWAYSAPPSHSRRFTPASPWMNIGMNTTLMAMNDPTKWILPSTSFIIRPVAFGYQ